MARAFDGSSYVIGSIGSLVGIGNSAHTILAICRRGANGAWHTPLSIESSANSSRLSMQFSNTNTIQLIIGASNKDTTVSIGTADGWVLAAVTRASGMGTPRGHKYVYSSNTWTHTDAGAATGGDSTDLTGGRIQIGRWQTTDLYSGDILLVAAWERALSDAELENLPFSLQALYAAAPEALWLLDQAATTQAVTDLTGNGANQTSLTGTSVSTNSVPLWNYSAGPSVAIGQSGGNVDATPTPASIAAAASVPTPTIAAGSTTTPSAVAATTSVPTPSILAGSRPTPTQIAAAATVPTPTVSAGATPTPGAVAAVAAIPTPSVSASATVTPAAVAVTVAVPTPTIQTAGNATVSPDAIAAVVQIQSVTLAVGSAATPSTVAALVSVPAATVNQTTARATSDAAVTARRTSASAVTAGRTSIAAVTARRTSTSTVGG